MMTIQRFHSRSRMSQAVVHNGTVWLAGQVGNPGDSVTEQTRTILGTIEELLAEAGSDRTRILSATIWLSDIRHFDEMNSVWDQWLKPEHAPARACGEARLATPGYDVEIMIIAATGE